MYNILVVVHVVSRILLLDKFECNFVVFRPDQGGSSLTDA